MQRLNIPLKSANNTTRQSRRVVWPLAWVVGAGLIFYVIVQMVIGRTTLLVGAPDGSAVFDVVGRGALTTLAEHLGDLPLLANKPVTLNSLLPYLRGEVLYEILPDFSRIIAFRGQLTADEVKMFQDFGVWVGDVDGVTVLSDAPQEIKTWKRGLGLHLSSAWPGFAGVAKLDSKKQIITVGADGVSLWKYRSLWPHGGAPTLPQGTVAWVPFAGESFDFSPYFGALVSLGLDQSMQSLLLDNSGSFLLLIDEGGWGYRLSLDQPIESQKLAQILQSSVALMTPTTKSKTLIDGTTIDEMSTDPSQVKMSVEETASGVIVRAEGGRVKLTARQSGEITVITNRSDLLDAKIGGARTTVIFPKQINQAMTSTAVDQNLVLWNFFEKISISPGKYRLSW